MKKGTTKKQDVLYMVFNNETDVGSEYWETYESIESAQNNNPDGKVIYQAILKPVGKTKSVLVDL